MVFHEAIKKAREASGKKKAEVARDLKMPYTTYDGYEKGYRQPSPDLALSIMRYYQIDPYLVTGEKEEKEESSPRAWNRGDDNVKISERLDKLNHKGRERVIDFLDSLIQAEEYTTPDPKGSESAAQTVGGQYLSEIYAKRERQRELNEMFFKQYDPDASLIEMALRLRPEISEGSKRMIELGLIDQRDMLTAKTLEYINQTDNKLVMDKIIESIPKNPIAEMLEKLEQIDPSQLDSRISRIERMLEDMEEARRSEIPCPDEPATEAEQSDSEQTDCGKQDTP